MEPLRWFGKSAGAALLFTSVVGLAAPTVGSALPVAHVVDSQGNRFELRSSQGRPVLVVYEDKDSSQLNSAFKAELGRLASSGKYKTTVSLVPVADVRGYDYWPVRGFVKDAIRDESKKQGTTIYCDWNGDFSRALSIQSGTSTIVLYGRNGRVLFAKGGKLTSAEVQQLIALLRSEVEPGPS